MGGILVLFMCLIVYMRVGAINDEKKYNRVLNLSKDYPVRCYTLKMKECDRFDLIPADLPEEPDQDTRPPINLTATITTHGLCITARSKTDKEEIIPDAESPFGLFGIDWSSSVIIPVCYINLSCMICRSAGGFLRELSPSNLVRQVGEPPQTPSGEVLMMVMLFRSYVKKSAPKSVERLERPLKLKMFVIDDDGHDNVSATWELYTALSESMHPSPPDDDDSWMYHSRPIYW